MIHKSFLSRGEEETPEVQENQNSHEVSKSHEIQLFDTWNKQLFNPLAGMTSGKPLKVYVCGPTVYTNTHIGHVKTYMTFDIMRSVLEYLGVPMTYMMNITNVDDKIIKATYQKEYGFADDFNLDLISDDKILPNNKFIDFANYWENDFFSVMDQLKIKRPNIVSRVTDYINEIFQFVEEIDKNGFAFEDNGSVYFYGTKYDNITDDNGDFSKSPNDPLNFVLLKKVRKYEPGWESKWGPVRPGWHIECSAMASSVLGPKIDIHGGGIDLKFPHHHNEVLQSNARFGYTDHNKQSCDASCGWVNAFMHTGHLNISGLKMSRSLKNFITAADSLKEHTPDQLRMLFLLHKWNDSMDYSDDTMKHATYYTDFFTNFFVQTSSILLRPNVVQNKKFGEYELSLLEKLSEGIVNVDFSLKNNIDTSSAIKHLYSLIGSLYVYVTLCEASAETISKDIVLDVVEYVRKILGVFRLDIGSSKGVDSGREEKLIKVVSDIRVELRTAARNMAQILKPIDLNASKELPKDLYALTDKIRDVMLPGIGITLTDK